MGSKSKSCKMQTMFWAAYTNEDELDDDIQKHKKRFMVYEPLE